MSASKEVSDALHNYKAEQERYEIRKMEVQALSDAVNSSEINMIDSKFKQLNSIVELYKALGGGWKK